MSRDIKAEVPLAGPETERLYMYGLLFFDLRLNYIIIIVCLFILVEIV